MDETKKITLSKETMTAFKLVQSELRAARAEAVIAQQNISKAEADARTATEQLSAEITEQGAWDVTAQDWNTGEISLKITELGKSRKAKEAAETAEVPVVVEN